VSGSNEISVRIVTRQRVRFPSGPNDFADYSLQTCPHILHSMENGVRGVLTRQYSWGGVICWPIDFTWRWSKNEWSYTSASWHGRGQLYLSPQFQGYRTKHKTFQQNV